MELVAFGLAVTTIATVVVAAKAHGRELRLLREAHGHRSVDFRRNNHPWVEELWRRDRVWFWRLFAALATLSLLFLIPRFGTWPFVGWLAFAWALSLAASFVAMGLWSFIRLRRSGLGESSWRRASLFGSLAWWAFVAALSVADAALAVSP